MLLGSPWASGIIFAVLDPVVAEFSLSILYLLSPLTSSLGISPLSSGFSADFDRGFKLPRVALGVRSFSIIFVWIY